MQRKRKSMPWICPAVKMKTTTDKEMEALANILDQLSFFNRFEELVGNGEYVKHHTLT